MATAGSASVLTTGRSIPAAWAGNGSARRGARGCAGSISATERDLALRTRTPAQAGVLSLCIDCDYGCVVSGWSQREIRPPTMPPRIGATQNSHSDVSAMPPPKIAVAVERAGLTEAFEIGIAMR